MPTFELEMNGKSYEVDAPSIEAFQQAYQGGGQGGQQGGGDFLHPVKPEPQPTIMGRAGSVLERLGQYPRMFLGEINDAGETLGKVSRGEIDATSPEAIEAARTFLRNIGPAGEFAGTGAQIARREAAEALPKGAIPNPNYVPPTPGMQAAQTAIDVGQPLPAGITSNTPGVQAFTQGFRQVPLVGPHIGEGVQSTVRATGRRVGEIAEDLGGGAIQDRATAGATTREALKGVIEKNNDDISDLYKDLRENHIKSNVFASPAETKAVLSDIKAKRWSAVGANPMMGNKDSVGSGLSDIENLVSSGRSIDGLIRARNDIGSAVGANARNPNPGFPAGDMKRLYGALSTDIKNAVTNKNNIRPGSSKLQAMEAFNLANNSTKDIVQRNTNLQTLLNIKNDEGLTGSVLNAAKSKTGNFRVLTELRNQMKPEDFNKIVSVGLNELGHTDQGFSLARFGKGWSDLNPQAKGLLVQDPAHRKALDDIANLGSFLKDADKYRNTSNTAHGAGVFGVLTALGHAIGTGSPEEIGGVLASLAGGYGISRILGRPASASALRKWMTIARDKNQGRFGPVSGARAMTALSIASRNLQNNLPDPAQAEQPKREPLRVTVHPKAQDRFPLPVARPNIGGAAQ